MKPPGIMRIMGQRFRVKVFAAVGASDFATSNKLLLGHCDPDMQYIRLARDGVGDDKAREVYLHEALHAIVALAGHDTEHEGLGPEEQFVNRLAPILLQFLRDNPRVYEYLTSRWVGSAGSAT